MKSLMIPAWFGVAPGDFTGVFVLEHARAVKKVGWEADLLYVDRRRGEKSEQVEHGGVGVYVSQGWYPPKYGLLTHVWYGRYSKIFKEYCEKQGKPDIIHAHSYIAGLAALYLSRKFDIPYIITEHSTIFSTGIPGRHRSVVERVFQGAKALVAVSGFLADQMRPYAGDQEIGIIPNPVDAVLFSVREAQVDEHAPTIVSVGAMIKRKGLNTLIRAFKEFRIRYPESRLILAGDGSEDTSLRNLSQQLNLQDAVIFKGPLNLRHIATELRKSDIYVSSSSCETFGVSLAEALMSGLPVVSTPSGGPQSFIDNSNGIVIDGFDSSKLAQAMIQVADNLNSYHADVIRQSAIAQFSLQTVGQQIVGVYENVLNAQP